MQIMESNLKHSLDTNRKSILNSLILKAKLEDFTENTNPNLLGKSLENVFSKSEFGEFQYYFRAGKNFITISKINNSQIMIFKEFLEQIMTQIVFRDYQIVQDDEKISVIFR